MTRNLPPKLVVLIGPPGAGKTTVGRELASLLGWQFVDTDTMVEEDAGKPVAEIFLADGEAAFRERERQVVRRAITQASEAVVALGGGAPMDPQTQLLLPLDATVFLDVSEAVAIRRVGLARARPLLAASPRARWRALMARRRPVYESLAAQTVPTDDARPRATAEQIAHALGLTA